MIVVIDTNIWIQELALNSASGAAVRFFLRQRKAQIAVPEVVRLEVERNFRDMLKKYVSDIDKNYRQLLKVFGRLKELVLPDDSAIESKVGEIFAGLGVELLEIPFSIESARSSLLKTIDKLPPSDKNQQFKDGVLWADCLKLLRCDEVFLVTSDTAFFQNRDYDKGLAKELAVETVGQPNSIKIFRSLTEMLADLKIEVILDNALLVQLFLEQNRDSIDAMLDRNRFRIEKQPLPEVALFATEDPKVLYINFKIDVPCSDLSDQERRDAFLHLKGDGSYDMETETYQDMRILGQELEFVLSAGSKGTLTNYILRAEGIFLGHRDVVDTARYPLSNENQ